MDVKLCRSCGSKIVWALTSAGKRMPVDVEPHPNGNVELVDDGKWAIVHPSGPGMFDEWVGHHSHFATCPDANDWRS